MPSGAVDDKHAVGARRHLGRDFSEMQLHGLGVAAWQDKSRADATLGTDGAENVSRLRTLILGRGGSAAAWRPASGEFGFLANPGLVLPPNL